MSKATSSSFKPSLSNEAQSESSSHIQQGSSRDQIRSSREPAQTLSFPSDTVVTAEEQRFSSFSGSAHDPTTKNSQEYTSGFSSKPLVQATDGYGVLEMLKTPDVTDVDGEIWVDSLQKQPGSVSAPYDPQIPSSKASESRRAEISDLESSDVSSLASDLLARANYLKSLTSLPELESIETYLSMHRYTDDIYGDQLPFQAESYSSASDSEVAQEDPRSKALRRLDVLRRHLAYIEGHADAKD